MSLLRQLWDLLQPGDVLLGDRLMANWTGICMLQQRGVDFVGRLNKANRRADFRRGIRLGKDDHIVRWQKPTSIRSVDRRTYYLLPDSITVREVRFQVEQPGFRTRLIVVVTTYHPYIPHICRVISPNFLGGQNWRRVGEDGSSACGPARQGRSN